MLPAESFFPFAGGGVCGNVKLYNPNIKLADAVRYIIIEVSSGFTPAATKFQRTKLMTKPATIQPIVPNTRIMGNCFSWSVMI